MTRLNERLTHILPTIFDDFRVQRPNERLDVIIHSFHFKTVIASHNPVYVTECVCAYVIHIYLSPKRGEQIPRLWRAGEIKYKNDIELFYISTPLYWYISTPLYSISLPHCIELFYISTPLYSISLPHCIELYSICLHHCIYISAPLYWIILYLYTIVFYISAPLYWIILYLYTIVSISLPHCIELFYISTPLYSISLHHCILFYISTPLFYTSTPLYSISLHHYSIPLHHCILYLHHIALHWFIFISWWYCFLCHICHT